MVCQRFSHRSPVNFLQLQPMSLPAPNQCYMILSFLILFTPRVIFPLSICFLLNSSVFFFFLAATRINLPRSLSILMSSQWEGRFRSPKRRCSPKHMKFVCDGSPLIDQGCCIPEHALDVCWAAPFHCSWGNQAGSCLAQVPLAPVFTYDSRLNLSPVSNSQY